MIGPALQGAQLISNIGRVAPWVLSGASMIPGIPGAVNAAGRFLNQPAAPYNPGGGGMGGRRGTSGGTTFTKPTGSLRDYGAGYKEAELRAGAAAENFRPGAGFPGQQTPAVPFSVTSGAGSFAPIDPYAAQNREYERERARVEAMVKANPDMQKQAIADERAKVRDQGMALWAKANPTLAKQVKPGAVGYDAIQRGIGIQSIPSIENRAEFSWNQATQGPTPAVPMADAMLNPASPGFIGGEGPPPVNFADPRFENMSPEEFQKLLNQYTKR